MTKKEGTTPRKDGSPADGCGLYVHVPFCRKKCRYCDFYSIPSTSLVPQWLSALATEIALYAGSFPRFGSLYLGGGTPSLLGERELGDLLEEVFRHFSFSGSPEITLEANPDDMDRDTLRAWRRLGINRLSLGVQSLSEEELLFLGRRHTARQALLALERIRSEGFPHFSVDLIFGLPGQSVETWGKTLERVLSFHPSHLSCYQLTLSEGTPLWALKRRGGFEPPGEEEERKLFLCASETLEGRGYVHYEISNFALRRRRGPGFEAEGRLEAPWGDLSVCRHNLKYWNRTSYLGLGPSAHSFLEKRRWWNHRSVERYCEDLFRGRLPVEGEEFLSGDQARLEALFLGLRTKTGIVRKDFCGSADTERALSRLVRQGYVNVIKDRIIPTRKGFLVADRLPMAFL